MKFKPDELRNINGHPDHPRAGVALAVAARHGQELPKGGIHRSDASAMTQRCVSANCEQPAM